MAVKKSAAKKAATNKSPAKKPPARKPAKKTEGEETSRYFCDICGLVVSVDSFGNAEVLDLTCCGEPMSETA